MTGARPAALAVPARAKLNLRLEVTGVREDGRHELDTVFQAISLGDLLEVRVAAATTLEVSGDFDAGPPDGNLVLAAARALEAAAGRPLPAAFRLLKRIPAGAGMGGGSSDAAAALRALARLHGVDCDLAPIAAGLGADVPFFLRGGRARAVGAGDVLLPGEPAAESDWFALAWPGFGVPTAAVYAAWDAGPRDPARGLQSAAESVEPRLLEFAAVLGAGWRMTGSGSAFFRPCTSAAEAHAHASRLGCWSAVARAMPGWAG